MRREIHGCEDCPHNCQSDSDERRSVGEYEYEYVSWRWFCDLTKDTVRVGQRGFPDGCPIVYIPAVAPIASVTEFSRFGGLRKISAQPPCQSPEHNPPRSILLEPGEYEYVCPSCGEGTTFTVHKE